MARMQSAEITPPRATLYDKLFISNTIAQAVGANHTLANVT